MIGKDLRAIGTSICGLAAIFMVFGVGVASADNSLDVNATAAMNGTNFGLEVIHDGTTTKAYVEDDSPNGETVYRVAFWIDPANINMTVDRSNHVIFYGRQAVPAANTTGLWLQIRGDIHKIKAYCKKDDGKWTYGGKISITAPSLVQYEWTAGTGTGNGTMRMWKNGVLKESFTNIDNDTWVIDSARLGANARIDATTTGSLYLDEFESYRTVAP